MFFIKVKILVGLPFFRSDTATLVYRDGHDGDV